MSIFNPSDYIDNNINVGQILDEINGLYLGKTGFTTSEAQTIFNQPLTINNSISANGLNISPQELSCLDGVTSSIQQQINNINVSGGSILNTNNIFTGTNQFNSDIIVNSTNISPVELSYINNLSSNAQNQITSANNNISTINSVLTTNGITSSTNVNDTLNYLQSQITNLPNGSGAGQSYFLTDITSSIDNQFKTISTIPANGTNQTLTTGVITSSSPNQLMGQFITASALNITEIPAGIYDFNFYANLTNNNLSSYLIIEVYKLSSTLTQTLLFTLTGSDINSSVIIPYNINGTQPAFTVATTDYLMIKIFGKTTSSQNVTINVDYNSSNNYSHLHIPFVLKSNHNDLLNIQGGQINQYNHLTNAQLDNISNPASISQNGYLTSTSFNTFNNKASTTQASTSTTGLLNSTDWNIFNNKQNLISQNSAFNKNYETSASNIKMNGVVSLGILDTIPRADHIHPVDTSREPLITSSTSDKFFNGSKQFVNITKSDVGLSNVSNTDFTQGRNNIIYINGFGGNDNNDGLSLLTAYKTINGALNNSLANSGVQYVVYPGIYVEDININKNNFSIVGTNGEIGGIISINGNITVSSSNTSIRLCSLTFNNFTYSGTSSNVYLKDCNINGNITKSGSGFLSINNVVCNLTTAVSISGSGNVNAFNGSSLGASLLVNNSAAIINISNCLQMANIQVLAGICSINNVVVYATNSSLNAVTSSAGSFVYLSNLSIVNGNDNSPGKVNLLGFWSINNVNYNKLLSVLTGVNLQREYIFDKLNITNNLNVVGNINNTSPTQLSYLDATSSIQTQLNNTINLNGVQTLSNKTMTNMKLNFNQFYTNAGYEVNFPETNGDNYVTYNNAIQTLTNKTLTDMKLTNNTFKTNLGYNVNFAEANGDVIIGGSTTSPGQTMYNKLFYNGQINNCSIDGDCTAITQTTNNVSNKIATTAFIDNKLSSPNTYVATSYATFSTYQVTTSYADILTITIPVAGTYEIIMNIMGSPDQTSTVTNILFNSTTSTEVPNSLFTIQTPNLGLRSTTNISKSMILQNVAANTVLKVRSKATAGGTNNIYNDATNGYTFISYRMLGLVASNVITTNTFGVIGTLPLTLSFNDYTMLYDGATSLKIKKTSATTLTWGGVLSYTPIAPYFGSNNLIANTYANIFFTGSSYPSLTGMTLNGAMTDETNTYNIQIVCIIPNKFSISIQKVI